MDDIINSGRFLSFSCHYEFDQAVSPAESSAAVLCLFVNLNFQNSSVD
jgi:hypothetical protein